MKSIDIVISIGTSSAISPILYKTIYNRHILLVGLAHMQVQHMETILASCRWCMNEKSHTFVLHASFTLRLTHTFACPIRALYFCLLPKFMNMFI